MRRARVLVVDDSSVARRLISDVLAGDPELEVAAVASSGPAALARISQVEPDVVTLDVEMDEMSGLDVLRRIRSLRPALPVVMFSALTRRGAEATIDALLLGASDYLAKPSGTASAQDAIALIRVELVPKIKALCRRVLREGPPAGPPLAETRGAPRAGRPASVVAIGVSTGGPNALMEVLPRLPADFPVPVLIVQHMPPVFTGLLANALAARSRIGVAEADDGARVLPGRAWIAPGDRHLAVEAGASGDVRLRVLDGPPENSCRPAADVLFRSVAEVYGPRALAVVLTGMGQDGFRGCQHVRDRGGRVLAQDEATSVVWGMPGFVVRGGLAEAVVPLERVAAEIVARVEAPAPIREAGRWT